MTSRFSNTAEQLRNIAEDMLFYAKQKGASAAALDISEGMGQTVTVRKGEVETIEYNRDKGLGITVYLGQQRGHASTSDFSPQAVRDTVDAALAIARYTASDDCAGLPDPELLASDWPELALYFPWDLTVEQAIEEAWACEASALAQDKRIKNSEGATINVHEAQFVHANSLGFIGGYPSSRHSLSCAVIAEDKKSMERDYWYSSARAASDLIAGSVIGTMAAERAVRRLNAKQLDTRQVPVLFEAPIASSLLGQFARAISGGSLYRKSSFLLDQLGQSVFADHIQLDDIPDLPRGLASSPFDNEGVRVQRRRLVDQGILTGYLLSSYAARKLGMVSTGNAGGSHNLILSSSQEAPSFDALLKKMDTGLLVTELLGSGVNMVTGDYSRGAAGFWVECGEIQYPVQEITIAGNLRDMFRQIVAVGSDVHLQSSKQTGSILIESMMVAGQ